MLTHLTLDLISVIENSLRSAIFLHQLDGGLHPHALYAGHVVRLVTRQRQNVDHLMRWYTKDFFHTFWINENGVVKPLFGIVEGNLVIYQLIIILVPSHQKNIHPLFRSTYTDRSHQVIRLITGQNQLR
ncbi:hypothetical protein BMS3Bbin04_00570 [bacterium BMS3Bbin04]|nr:hypothetical protein BMS3Bbin04_00570 [bacterium BMS3Bbin04]